MIVGKFGNGVHAASILLLVFILPRWTAATARAANELPRLIQTIPLPGVEGRIDHLAVDTKGQRLFVAALGNDTTEVLDLQAGRLLKSLRGLHEPQGVAFTDDSRLFVANGEGGTVNIFQGERLRPLPSIRFGDDADNLRYDKKAKRVYVGFGSGALGVLDDATLRRVGTIALAGHPESFQLERQGRRAFVNVPSALHVAVVDRQKQQVVATWPVTEARSNFPMALDEAQGRLFIGCRNPARLLIYNTETGKRTSSVEIDGDTDDIFYDAAQKRLYISCGAGFLDVVAQKGADRYERLARIPTAPGARTALFVPELARLYLAVPHRGSQRAEIRVYDVNP